VSSRPPAEHTGITVLLGGNQLRTVDFDRGRVTAIAQARLHAGEFVIGLTTSSQTYAVTAVCPSPGAGRRLRLLRIGADGSVAFDHVSFAEARHFEEFDRVVPVVHCQNRWIRWKKCGETG